MEITTLTIVYSQFSKDALNMVHYWNVPNMRGCKKDRLRALSDQTILLCAPADAKSPMTLLST